MTWSSMHRQSEELAMAAHDALQAGKSARARGLFAQAAAAEALAFDSIGADKGRTLGITAVSAVSLWYKAGRLAEAEHLAHRALAAGPMPEFATAELRALLQMIWNEQTPQESSIPLVPGHADTETVLRGKLRALHLDKDWLEVVVGGEPRLITGAGEFVNDVIGPMVNQEVRVRVRVGKRETSDRTTLTLIDIERQ